MPKLPKKHSKPTTAQDYENLGRMLASIYESGYVDHNKTFKMSFLKGIAAGFGGVIGATLVVAIVLWSLSFLDSTPFVGRAIQNLKDTLQTRQK